MTDILDGLSNFFVMGEGSGTDIVVESVKSPFSSDALDEFLHENPAENLTIRLPKNKFISDFESAKILMPSSGYVKQLTVETDQMIEADELHWLAGVEHLGLAMRRPKEGLSYLDSEEFTSSLLSYVSYDAHIDFTLFTSTSGPSSRSGKLSEAVKSDIAKIDSAFAGFKNYQGCQYKKRMPYLIG